MSHQVLHQIRKEVERGNVPWKFHENIGDRGQSRKQVIRWLIEELEKAWSEIDDFHEDLNNE